MVDLTVIPSLLDGGLGLPAISCPTQNSPTCRHCCFPPTFAACSVKPHPHTLQWFSLELSHSTADFPRPRTLTQIVAGEVPSEVISDYLFAEWSRLNLRGGTVVSGEERH